MSVALITGASRGIGRSIALAMAQAGHHVIINFAGNETAADETLAAVKAAGGSGQTLRFDVSDDAAVSGPASASANGPSHRGSLPDSRCCASAARR